MKHPMKNTAFRLPADMRAWLQAQAKKKDRDQSYIVRSIIQAEMSRAEKRKATA